VRSRYCGFYLTSVKYFTGYTVGSASWYAVGAAVLLDFGQVFKWLHGLFRELVRSRFCGFYLTLVNYLIGYKVCSVSLIVRVIEGNFVEL